MRLDQILPAVLLLLAAGAAAPTPQEAPKTVAVLRFDNNTGDERYAHLGRAMSAMMISDLSVIEGIRFVERERVEVLLEELDLQQSGYADPATAVNVGMISGAQYVITGAFASVDPEMRLDPRVASVETTEIIQTADATGLKDELFALQQILAEQLIEGLALALTEEDRERLRAQQEANRIDNVEAALAFSHALCLLDEGAYVEAFDQIQDVQSAAPASALVRGTLDLLKDKVADAAKSSVTDRANRAIGGLLGRRRQAQPPSRPASARPDTSSTSTCSTPGAGKTKPTTSKKNRTSGSGRI